VPAQKLIPIISQLKIIENL